MRPQPVAPGVYLVVGALGDPAPANGGRVSNLGIIGGSEGAIVVGTGTSLAEGEALLAAAERVASVPVVLAINPDAAPDQVLGNAAFVKRGIPVLAHEETARFLVANCARSIERLREHVGTEEQRSGLYSIQVDFIKMQAPNLMKQTADLSRSFGKELCAEVSDGMMG